jgi:multimeric flavodoxin WrbA
VEAGVFGPLKEYEPMSVQVLGVSGSPILDSNTDRAVKRILEETGLRTQFVKLSELEFSPCRACLGCVNSNQCVVADDARELAEQFRDAPAFVLGGYTPYSSLDARSKAFMERMYCHRHRYGRNSGKVGVSVITTACAPGMANLPAAAETAAAQVAFWMMEEGMENLGSMIVHGNVPCIRCGRGDACPMSGIQMLFGPEATVESVGVNTFEENPSLLRQARELGEKIRRAVLAGADVRAT